MSAAVAAMRKSARFGAWQGWVALLAVIAAVALPLLSSDASPRYLLGEGLASIAIVAFVAAITLAALDSDRTPLVIVALIAAAAALIFLALGLLPDVAIRAAGASGGRVAGAAGFWALVVCGWMLLWWCVRVLSDLRPRTRAGSLGLNVLIPVIFGVGILFLWEVIVRGFAVPFVVMPPPSAVWAKLTTSVPTLWADFQQTFLKSVLAGYVIGCGSGFIVALIVDRIPFLRRGLLPIGNLVSALPIIGIAPIMVMWFGFDWQSKAAVVVAMTFFPMLVNTLAGLAASDAIERDLMRTYAASHGQSLLKLRLPAALPFIFNALKINSTLAVIGAIVAEFFGTPVVGMGFRISTEVGRMNTDMVWAEIALAAVAGSAFYGAIALLERLCTFWHPSFRQS